MRARDVTAVTPDGGPADGALAHYLAATRASRRAVSAAAEHLPGGDSRSTLYHPPYPLAFREGGGCRVIDLDGNELLDFTGNHSSLVHGYGHPRILAAATEQASRGTVFPGLTTIQVEFAEQLRRRIRSLELVRFTSSGTEATMQAVRAARAHTGRPLLAKIEGGYNGSWDEAMVSTHPSAAEAGNRARPVAVRSSEGLSPEVDRSVVVLPFNDEEAARRLLEERGSALAAVIVEPVLGSAGMIPATPAYLRALRKTTQSLGIVLIFDEVVSFRIAHGGAQALYGVEPDLTCLGKALGGGFPLGAFGGRRELMSVFDPSRGRPRVPHPGSYNANPASLAAGAASLALLTEPEIARLNANGDAVRESLRVAFSQAGIAAEVTGIGSLFGIHFIDRPVRSWREALAADEDARHRLFLGLFREGILIDPRGVGCLSTAIGDDELESFDRAVRRVTSSPAVASGDGAARA